MVKIKICGVTNSEDYQAAQMLGVDYIGFIFYEKSPRYVGPDTAAAIVGSGLQKNNRKVGVFVNEKIDTVREVFECARLDIVQLHGCESPEYCRRLDLPYWKAIRVKDESSLALMEHYNCDTFLLDTHSEKRYGGTGVSFDHAVAEKAIQFGKRIVIAGGVSRRNIDRIIGLSPFAVDINSSIEERPGKKDLRNMRAIVEKIRTFSQGNH